MRAFSGAEPCTTMWSSARVRQAVSWRSGSARIATFRVAMIEAGHRTPTGSLPSPRWRWWARGMAVAAVVGLVSSVLGPLAVRALAEWLPVARGVAFVITGLAIPVGAASLVVRFRRARGLERQQLRWLAVGGAPVAVAVLAIAALVLAGNEVSLGWLVGVCLAVLPLLLSGAYAGVALGLGQLLGRTSSLAVAVATLTVAAVFQPARRRIQRAVDRRFNRRRHDAAQTIQAFSARLRQQVDLEVLTAELLGVVEQTMQPTQVSLWLRPTVPVAPSGVPTAASRR